MRERHQCCFSDLRMPNPGTVLIVDDEPTDADLAGIAFREANCRNPLQVVTSGDEAIHYLAGSGKFVDRSTYPFPVLLLLDLKMPRQTGFDVLRWLNRHPETKAKLKVVVWSSFMDSHSVQALRGLGVRAFFEKPLSLNDLREQFLSFKARWPDTLQ